MCLFPGTVFERLVIHVYFTCQISGNALADAMAGRVLLRGYVPFRVILLAILALLQADGSLVLQRNCDAAKPPATRPVPSQRLWVLSATSTGYACTSMCCFKISLSGISLAADSSSQVR